MCAKMVMLRTYSSLTFSKHAAKLTQPFDEGSKFRILIKRSCFCPSD